MPKSVVLLKNRTIPRDAYEDIFKLNGIETIFIPLLKHSHHQKNDTVKFLCSEDFTEVPHFIITSQRAVECFDECLQEINSEDIRQKVFEKTAYTVGPATEKVLRKLGFSDVRGGANAGNGAKLAEIILKEIDPDDRIVFFTGKVRKDIIPRKLKEANIKIEEKVVYETEDRTDIPSNFRNVIEQLDNEQKHWLIFFSPQGTQSIVQQLQGESHILERFHIGSIGPTTEEYLKENDISALIVPQNPEAGSLLSLIIEFENENKRH